MGSTRFSSNALLYRYQQTWQRAVQVWRDEGGGGFGKRLGRRLLSSLSSSSLANPERQYEIEVVLKNPSIDLSKIDLQSRLAPAPLVSIIVPVYNGISFVPRCLESYYQSPVGVRFELIVVDNGSTDDVLPAMRSLAETHPNLKIIANPTNLGFAEAINQGAAAAHGEFLAVCNSDIIVTPGWLDRLVFAMRSDPALAVASPVTNYVGEGPQLDQQAGSVTPETANQYAQKVSGQSALLTVPDRLVFFCVLIRRSHFELLGGITDAFGLGNFEDDDFCLRARMAGFSLAVLPGCFVFHYGSKTFQEQKIDHVQWMVKNEKIYYGRTAEFSTQIPYRHKSPRSLAWKPMISVIVRTKDRPYALRRALNSLANQTFRDFEIVLVNDGGASLKDLLLEYAPYLDINYVHFPESIGRSAALNAGFKHVQASWVGYLDDDDILYPTHLDLLTAEIPKHPDPGLIYSDANKVLCWSEDQQQELVIIDRMRFAPPKQFSLDELLVDNWMPIMSYIHPLRLVEEIGGYNESFSIFEDWEFLIRIAGKYPFYNVPRPTCEYRFRFGDQFDDSTLQQRENALKYRSAVYEIYSAKNDEIATKRRDTMIAVARQMEDVQRIMELRLTKLQRSFLIAARLGGFPLPEDMRS